MQITELVGFENYAFASRSLLEAHRLRGWRSHTTQETIPPRQVLGPGRSMRGGHLGPHHLIMMLADDDDDATHG